jgi:clan AA aspartic protease (TIGR02281 family)
MLPPDESRAVVRVGSETNAPGDKTLITPIAYDQFGDRQTALRVLSDLIARLSSRPLFLWGVVRVLKSCKHGRPRTITLRRILVLLCVLAAVPAFAARCQLVRVAEWPVNLERNRAVVDGSINGHPVGVLIDTGASRTVIARSAAERLGLDRVDAGIQFYGIGGRSRAELTEIEEFRLGDAVHKNWRVLVAGEQPMRDVAVILGEDFFENLDLELDFGNKVMRLFQPRDCDKASLAYWAPDTPPLKMATVRRVTVDAEVNGVPLLAMIDTGATRSTLDLGAARRAGVTPLSAGVTSGGCVAGIGRKPLDAFIAPIERFAIGDEIIRDARIPMANMAGHLTREEIGSHIPKSLDMPEMLLGVDFLLAHRVFVSHAQRAVYFTHNGRTPVFDNRPSPTCSERAAERKDGSR